MRLPPFLPSAAATMAVCARSGRRDLCHAAVAAKPAGAMGRGDRAASAAASDRASRARGAASALSILVRDRNGARHHRPRRVRPGGASCRRFVEDRAPLMIVLALSSSMDQPDVAPTRLERAKQKVSDLIAARAGARSGLIAYAGTAHLVDAPDRRQVGHRAVPRRARDWPDAQRRQERYGRGYARGPVPCARAGRRDDTCCCRRSQRGGCNPSGGRSQRRHDTEGGAGAGRRAGWSRFGHRSRQRGWIRHPGDRTPDRNALPGGARRRVRHAVA